MKDSYYSQYSLRDSQIIQTLKIITPQSIKRFELLETYKDLQSLITTSFKQLPLQYSINYYDEDSDCITIESQIDYENAVSYAKQFGLRNLKLYIVDHQEYIKSKEQIVIDPNIITYSFCCEMKCPLCKRKFETKISFIKHAKYCFRVFGMKREPFDSQKQRNKYNKYFYPFFIRINSLNCEDNNINNNEHVVYNWRMNSKTFRKELKKWKQMNK
jgi:hypothetical protein